MPFKSKAQQRFMFAAEARGELPKGKALEWAHETKNIKKLPERKMNKTAEQIADDVAEKVGGFGSWFNRMPKGNPAAASPASSGMKAMVPVNAAAKPTPMKVQLGNNIPRRGLLADNPVPSQPASSSSPMMSYFKSIRKPSDLAPLFYV